MCYRPEPTQEGTNPMSAAPAALASVLYERRENLAIVTLNRPGRMNTLGGSMKPDLARAFFEYARADERARGAHHRQRRARLLRRRRHQGTRRPADHGQRLLRRAKGHARVAAQHRR